MDALRRTVLVLFGQGGRDQDNADALLFDPELPLVVASRRGTAPLEDGRHLPSQPTLSRLLDILSADDNRRGLREAITELADRRLRASPAPPDHRRGQPAHRGLWRAARLGVERP